MRDFKVKLDNGFELAFDDTGNLPIVENAEAFRQLLAYLLSVDSAKMRYASEYAFNLGRFRGMRMTEKSLYEIKAHVLSKLATIVPIDYIDVQVVALSLDVILVLIFIEAGWYPVIQDQIRLTVRLNLQNSEVTIDE